MDEFLREINTSIFYKWLSYQDIQGLTKKIEDDTFYYTNAFGYGRITFNDFNIVEMEILDHKTNKNSFYLHFQMNNFKHALQLFYEFKDALLDLNTKTMYRVLLSCSGGLTTGFFAYELNEAAESLNLDYEFNATQYSRLLNEGKNFDLILLAPQISYLHAQIQSSFPHKTIIDLPSQVFAKYDKVAVFEIVKEAIEKQKNAKKNILDLKIKKNIHSNDEILAISYIRHNDNIRLGYRVYLNNKILTDKEVIKTTMKLEDIEDIIDTVLVYHPHIKKIGITMPGIINDGKLYLPLDGFDNTDIVGPLKKKYQLPVILSNDVNAIAVGLYSIQDEYESLSFIFKPRHGLHEYEVSECGVGTIIDGKLHKGRMNFSGEVKYMDKRSLDEKEKLSKTKEGNIELVGDALVSIISLIAPEHIIYYCDMIPDINELKDYINMYIPQEYIPSIEKTVHLKDYMLLGQMILCIEERES